MRRLLEWLLSLFGTKNKEQKRLEDKIKDSEEKLEEIADEETDIDDVLDRLNK